LSSTEKIYKEQKKEMYAILHLLPSERERERERKRERERHTHTHKERVDKKKKSSQF